MKSTSSGIIKFSHEEIDQMKYDEMQRYEKMQRQKTYDEPRYYYEAKPNRKERRKLKHLNEQKGETL